MHIREKGGKERKEAEKKKGGAGERNREEEVEGQPGVYWDLDPISYQTFLNCWEVYE